MKTLQSLLGVATFLLASNIGHAQTPLEGLGVNQPNSFYRLAMHAELGFLAPLEHQIQFSNNGTVVDYVNEGGQDNLFAVNRFSMDWMVKRHVFVLLYQPLELNTAVNARKTYVIENETFPEGDPLLIKYSFPFFRGSYMYNLSNDPSVDLEIGGSLQIEMLVLSSPQAMVKKSGPAETSAGSLTQTKRLARRRMVFGMASKWMAAMQTSTTSTATTIVMWLARSWTPHCVQV